MTRKGHGIEALKEEILMTLLTQNEKMKKSSLNGLTVFNFGIPAFKSKSGFMTCPNAGRCAVGCYAKSGAYTWPAVKNAHEKRLEIALSSEFTELMTAEINKLLKRKNIKKLVIRIHDSGDFFNAEYLAAWLTVIARFPSVHFYAYTKMITLFQGRYLPKNFRVIFSYGGKLDSLIDSKNDFHSRVFESLNDLKKAGYVDGSHDDMIAALGKSKKIGLVYHGAKNFNNTSWGKVAA